MLVVDCVRVELSRIAQHDVGVQNLVDLVEKIRTRLDRLVEIHLGRKPSPAWIYRWKDARRDLRHLKREIEESSLEDNYALVRLRDRKVQGVDCARRQSAQKNVGRRIGSLCDLSASSIKSDISSRTAYRLGSSYGVGGCTLPYLARYSAILSFWNAARCPSVERRAKCFPKLFWADPFRRHLSFGQCTVNGRRIAADAHPLAQIGVGQFLSSTQSSDRLRGPTHVRGRGLAGAG